jgi:serine phosphatase RsbU (regulator of sigma subunit)
MTGREPETGDAEIRRLHSEADALEDDIRDMTHRQHGHETLIARLRREAKVRDEEVAALGERLGAAEHELKDLRAIRDALTPPDLPERPGLELAAAFLPAAEQVSGDFYLVAEGPQDSTLLVIGDVVGHGLHAARRAAFVRTTFLANAPFSDDPCQLLNWANTALVERASTDSEFVTVACVTYLPSDRRLRWAYAGHPPALSMYDGRELKAPSQGTPLGIEVDADYVDGSLRSVDPPGVLLYTDGLTEARHDGEMFGLKRVGAVFGKLRNPSPREAIAVLRSQVAEFSYGSLSDDLCMLAARVKLE